MGRKRCWQIGGRFALMALVVSLMVGCVQPLSFEKEQADLMPRSVAMSIFEKHGYGEWTENPYLVNIGSFCGIEKAYVGFQQIETAQYNPRSRSLTFVANQRSKRFMCPILQLNFNGLSEEQARELTTAARSLGAKIEKLVST